MGKLTKTADTESESQRKNHTGSHMVAQRAWHSHTWQNAVRGLQAHPVFLNTHYLSASTNTNTKHPWCMCTQKPRWLFDCELPERHEQQTLPNGPPREPKPCDAQSDLRILSQILFIVVNAGGGNRQQTRLLAILLFLLFKKNSRIQALHRVIFQ